jgi:aquaporin rerated protein, other eukaryote
VKWLGGTHNTVRNHVIGMMGEFCGTFLFLFFSFSGTQIAVTASKASSPEDAVAKAPNTPNLLYISLAFSSSVAVNVWAFYRISGGMLNPAVRIGWFSLDHPR